MRYTHSFPLTRQDIDGGDPSDRKSCPVAWALWLHGYPSPAVDEYSTRPYGDYQQDVFLNTYAARAWIRDFDNDCTVPAGTIIVTVDTDLRAQGALDFVRNGSPPPDRLHV